MLNGSLPAFDLGAAQLLVIGSRAVAVLGLLSAFGTLLLRATAARPALAREDERATRRLAWGCLGLLALGLAAWTCLHSALLSETASAGGVLSAVGAVVPGTVFGRLIIAQAVAAALAGVALGLGWAWPAVVGSGVAVALQAGHLDAWAMQPGPSVLLVCEGLHLLAAGAWLGGLPGLALLVRSAAISDAAPLSRRFSTVRAIAVLVITGTAAWQGWQLSGGLPGLVGTSYGWMELVKLLLLLLMLGCAAANRFRFIPKLEEADPWGARRALGRSIVVQTLLGLLVICVAAVLTSLEPGTHVQPVWPFNDQPSLMVVQADPVSRREVADAVLALLWAVALVALGVAVRWLRWFAWALALAIAWIAMPHLDLLFVKAYPTSFYRSPTEFAATSIAEGAALYAAHCAACHGAEGRGDGPAAKGFKVPSADLTAEHLWGHSDGEMFWWLAHGILLPDGEVAMPGFADALSDDERWALIDYIRAHNAGLTHRATGAWMLPVQAPGFAAACGNGQSVTLADFRGQVVRLTFDAGPVAVAAESKSVGICTADDPEAPEAYGIVTGMGVAGTHVLVDANGWLRAVIPRGEDASVATVIARIARDPLPLAAAPVHRHGG